MSQDTIPSQLGPVTMPSTLGSAESSRAAPAESGLGSSIKWVLLIVAVAVVWFVSR